MVVDMFFSTEKRRNEADYRNTREIEKKVGKIQGNEIVDVREEEGKE